jgi:hypothetical protein
LLLDKLDDARRLANCSLQYSPSHPGFAAHALHLLGDIVTTPISKLHQRTGKHEQTRDHLTAAASMYREMDMHFYLEQAEAETTG